MSFSVQVEHDLKTLAHRFDAQINEKAFDNLKMLEDNEPGNYRYVFDEDHRIYKFIWAPVICLVKGQREIRPMRFSLLPHFVKTEDKKSPILEAYIHELESEDIWKKPLMNYHAVLPIKRFYEWVPKNGYKSMISFAPKDNEYLLVPCLYDNWFSEDKKKIIQSFAILTGSAPEEIAQFEQAHAPVALDELDINKWLTPQNHDRSQLLSMLQNSKHGQYTSQWMM